MRICAGRLSCAGAALCFGLASLIWAAAARAETIESKAKTGQVTALFPVFAFERESCAAYPVRDVRITQKPRNGVAELVPHKTPVEQVFKHCKGKSINMIWIVYRSNPGFTGHDAVSVSWTTGGNTLEMLQRPRAVDVDIAVGNAN